MRGSCPLGHDVCRKLLDLVIDKNVRLFHQGLRNWILEAVMIIYHELNKRSQPVIREMPTQWNPFKYRIISHNLSSSPTLFPIPRRLTKFQFSIQIVISSIQPASVTMCRPRPALACHRRPASYPDRRQRPAAPVHPVTEHRRCVEMPGLLGTCYSEIETHAHLSGHRRVRGGVGRVRVEVDTVQRLEPRDIWIL